MIEFALRSYLSAQASVTSYTNDRIYPVRVPREADGTLEVGDKLTYRRKVGGRNHGLLGGHGHTDADFEIISYSRSYDSAKKLANEVRMVLQGFSGTFDTYAVCSVTHEDEEDDFIEPEDGSDEGWFVVVGTYYIKYQETVPTF